MTLKDFIWIESKKEGWVPSQVLMRSGDIVTVKDDTGKVGPGGFSLTD